MRIVVLADDRPGNKSCKEEHGLSLYIEVEGFELLMDVAQTDVFYKNAERLGIDLLQVKTVVLSHGHYDHSKGLVHLPNRKVIICHPDCFLKRYSLIRKGEFTGIGQSQSELEEKHALILSKEPYEITKNVWFLGAIPRNNEFEANDFANILENSESDEVLDDSGIVIKSSNGLIIISGCAHAGICNTIEYAKMVTQEEKVLAVLGGFHLKSVNDNTKKVINYFIENNVKQIYIGHCTSDKVCNEFIRALEGKAKVEVLGTGKQYTI